MKLLLVLLIELALFAAPAGATTAAMRSDGRAVETLVPVEPVGFATEAPAFRPKKGHFFERRLLKHYLRKARKNRYMPSPPFHFNVAGFFLGLILGIVGVVLAKIFYSKDIFYSSLIGFAVMIVVILLLIAL
jgi:hypothetical protein